MRSTGLMLIALGCGGPGADSETDPGPIDGIGDTEDTDTVIVDNPPR